MSTERLYHVAFIRNDNESKTYVSRINEPMTHQEACTFKSKMMKRDHGHHTLEEAKTNSRKLK